MKDVRIDISKLKSKHWETLINERFDFIITVCDRVK